MNRKACKQTAQARTDIRSQLENTVTVRSEFAQRNKAQLAKQLKMSQSVSQSQAVFLFTKDEVHNSGGREIDLVNKDSFKLQKNTRKRQR